MIGFKLPQKEYALSSCVRIKPPTPNGTGKSEEAVMYTSTHIFEDNNVSFSYHMCGYDTSRLIKDKRYCSVKRVFIRRSDDILEGVPTVDPENCINVVTISVKMKQYVCTKFDKVEFTFDIIPSTEDTDIAQSLGYGNVCAGGVSGDMCLSIPASTLRAQDIEDFIPGKLFKVTIIEENIIYNVTPVM